MLVDYAIRGPQAKQKQITIEKELRSIPDPHLSSMTNSVSGFKTSGGYANRFLQTDLTPEEVESYYREKLEEQQWVYMKEEEILSKRRVIFCRGKDETATLVLPEKAIQKSYEYSLTISWDETPGCR